MPKDTGAFRPYGARHAHCPEVLGAFASSTFVPLPCKRHAAVKGTRTVVCGVSRCILEVACMPCTLYTLIAGEGVLGVHKRFTLSHTILLIGD